MKENEEITNGTPELHKRSDQRQTELVGLALLISSHFGRSYGPLRYTNIEG